MTNIHWHSGTAYDFFISLLELYHAGDFGLRPYWTAGVRQRLSDIHRETLEHVLSYASVPLDWLSTLPDPKDAFPVLQRAADLSPIERFKYLTLPLDIPEEVYETIQSVSRGRPSTTAEKENLLRTLVQYNIYIKPAGIEQLLKDWKNPEKIGEQYLSALQEYYTVFFIEEEARIRPGLQTGLEQAQELAGKVPLNTLVEELSRGVQIEGVDSAQILILVPSYWSTPFIFPTHPAEGTTQIVFGCRPEFLSIAPGAGAPDPLVTALKSLADPTRLQILRHLTGKPLTPTALSHLLRLRPPTVLHHLHILRLARLVAIRVSESGEKRYTARAETINAIFSSVNEYIKKQD
jgi:DNA-binding transcriptional ArsR family regulator